MFQYLELCVSEGVTISVTVQLSPVKDRSFLPQTRDSKCISTAQVHANQFPFEVNGVFFLVVTMYTLGCDYRRSPEGALRKVLQSTLEHAKPIYTISPFFSFSPISQQVIQ